MVGPLSIRGDGDCDADDAEEHEHQRPPGEVGKAAVNGRYYAGDKGNDPGELSQLALSLSRTRHLRTHNANGDGGQRKGVANDAANAERSGSLAAVAVAVS